MINQEIICRAIFRNHITFTPPAIVNVQLLSLRNSFTYNTWRHNWNFWLDQQENERPLPYWDPLHSVTSSRASTGSIENVANVAAYVKYRIQRTYRNTALYGELFRAPCQQYWLKSSIKFDLPTEQHALVAGAHQKHKHHFLNSEYCSPVVVLLVVYVLMNLGSFDNFYFIAH